MITKLFTEINKKMDEVEIILKDNNYFTDLEKRIEGYNNRMMAVYNNEATEYINRVNRAIEYMEKIKKENDKMINFEIQHDEYQRVGTEYQNELIDELLDILKGSDKE